MIIKNSKPLPKDLHRNTVLFTEAETILTFHPVAQTKIEGNLFKEQNCIASFFFGPEES